MTLLLSPVLALAAQAVELRTDYTADRVLRVSAVTTTTVETTDFSIERDGEPMEGGFGGGFGDSETERTVVYLDKVHEHEDGRPTKVERRFDDAEVTGSMGSGERAREIDNESPLAGETLILTLEDGEVVAEMEGGEPDNSDVLKGHSLVLPLDGLLPADDVSAGDSWEPTAKALVAALLLDVDGALFPPPSFEGEGGGERGGRGGFRGGRGGGGTGFLSTAEWEIEATLAGARETVDGLDCVVIELEADAEGDLPERTSGRDRAPRAFGWAFPWWNTVDNTYEVKLEGKLYFAVEAKRPVKLELEGEFTVETFSERDRQGTTFTMSSTREGELEITVEIEETEL